MPERMKLREALSKIPRGRGQRYPRELKSRARTWASAERRRGASWESIAEALGVRAETVRVWCSASASASASASDSAPRMRRVELAVEERRTVSLATPSGYRIEELTVEEAVALLVKLR